MCGDLKMSHELGRALLKRSTGPVQVALLCWIPLEANL